MEKPQNGHPLEMAHRFCLESRLFDFAILPANFSEPVYLIYYSLALNHFMRTRFICLTTFGISIIFSEISSSDLLCFTPQPFLAGPVRLI